ncbi:hypothetical protein GpartN1_g2861.t1 [Galdieria partita]|uniref:HSF-type DNA-binding domain-containing protein n=1 Tax=Galdieria partita TaxID=83374 RepID=A0A9C7PVH4_9RHOD|nr:hypothetical protein GpartN1_g2861.t1 [Galdieria partita]
MSPTISGNEVENDDLLQNTSEVTHFPGQVMSQAKPDYPNFYEEVQNTSHETGDDNKNTQKVEEIQLSRKDGLFEKSAKAEEQQITHDGYYCYYANANPYILSRERTPPLTYPVSYPWPPTCASYNGMGSFQVVSITTPLNGTENNAVKSTKNEPRNPQVLATNCMPSNYNRNGLTAILDAVHQRERLSTHSIGSNAADSSSLGKESSESYTKLQEDTLQQTQETNENSSFRRSSHTMAKQVSDERIATPFLRKLYRLVSDPETEDLCSWTASGRSFVIWNPTAFSRDVLPNYFKHNNLSSFVRQLNQYGFHKMHPDAWEFGHARFIRGREDLVATIERRPSRPGKGRWNDRDDESNNSPLQKRPKTEPLGNTDSLEEARSKASLETTVDSVTCDQGPPYGPVIGGSAVSSNRLNSSATTPWQSYQPFVLNDTSHKLLKNGVEGTSTKSLFPQYCNPQCASSLSSGTVPWIPSSGIPATELEKRICMIERAIAQLYYTIHELCRDRDSLRHDILSIRTRVGEKTTEDDGKVSKEQVSTEQV